jgi:hypothetical protein
MYQHCCQAQCIALRLAWQTAEEAAQVDETLRHLLQRITQVPDEATRRISSR